MMKNIQETDHANIIETVNHSRNETKDKYYKYMLCLRLKEMLVR